MRILEYFLIINVLMLCAYSSITDIQHSIIQNKVILLSLLISAMLNGFYYSLYAGEYLGIFLMNFFVMTVMSLTMYFLSIWAAGDSKMMIAAVFSLPGRLFDVNTNVGIAPSISIIITAFSVSFLYVVIEGLIERIHNRDRLKSNLQMKIVPFVKGYLFCSIYIIFFHFLIKMISFNFYSDNILIISMIDLFLILIISKQAIFRNKYVLIPIAVFSFVVLSGNIWKNGLSGINLQIFILIGCVLFLRGITERYCYRKIPTKDIKPGMILSQNTILLFSASRIKGLPDYSTEDMRSRLTEEETENIKRWENSMYGRPEIEIVRKIPFAIFISIGVLIMLITKLRGVS